METLTIVKVILGWYNMDAHMRIELEQSLIEYKNKHVVANTKSDLSRELFLRKDFFHSLQHEFPEISHVEISNKLHSIENKLTKYRYDALIILNNHNEL